MPPKKDDDTYQPPSGHDESLSYPFTPYSNYEEHLEMLLEGCQCKRYTYKPKKTESVFLKLMEAPVVKGGKQIPLKLTFVRMKRKEETANVKFKRTLWLADIQDILPMQNSDAFKKHFGERGDLQGDTKSRSLSIFYKIPRMGPAQGCLDIVFPRSQSTKGPPSKDYSAWFPCLQYLKAFVKYKTEINPFQTTLDKLWCLGDEDGGGSLDRDEVFRNVIVKGMNLEMKPAQENQLWQQANRKDAPELQKEDFERLVWLIKGNHEVCNELWRKYTFNEVSRMRPVQLGSFLREEQGRKKSETANKEAMEDIMKELTGSVGGMTEQQWNIYLTQSSLNDALQDEAQEEMFQCMKRAWPDYYIKFACNIPKQSTNEDFAFNPDSPEQVIAELVQLNYRAFHMKLYGTKKGKDIEGCVGYVGDPKARKEDHCQLETALQTFKISAFQAGEAETPILLIFEVMEKKESIQEEFIKAIQEELGFRLKDGIAAQIIKSPQAGLKSFMVGAYPGEGVTLTKDWNSITFFKCVRYNASPETTKMKEKMQPSIPRGPSEQGTNPFIMIMTWENVNAQCESEAKWNNFRKFTHNFMCAYVPAEDGRKEETRIELQTGGGGEKVEVEVQWDDGVRVASAFGAGVNLVGVNTHLLHKGKGEGNNKCQVAIAAGVFEKNGNVGWTRKPITATRAVPLVNPDSRNQEEEKKKRRRKPGDVDDDEGEEPRFMQGPTKLELEIISAHQLPNEQPFTTSSLFYDMTDPFVGVRVDGLRYHWSHKTRTKNNNGFNPTWGESCTCDIPDVEEAIITFSVNEFDVFGDTTLAERALPVACLQSGYRCIPLKDKLGRPDDSTLFVRFKFVSRGDIVQLIEEEEMVRKQIKGKQGQMIEQKKEMDKMRKKLAAIKRFTTEEEKRAKEVKAEKNAMEEGDEGVMVKFPASVGKLYINTNAWKDLFSSVLCLGEKAKTEEELEAERKAKEESKLNVRTAGPPTAMERKKREEKRKDAAQVKETQVREARSIAASRADQMSQAGVSVQRSRAGSRAGSGTPGPSPAASRRSGRSPAHRHSSPGGAAGPARPPRIAPRRDSGVSPAASAQRVAGSRRAPSGWQSPTRHGEMTQYEEPGSARASHVTEPQRGGRVARREARS